MHAVPGDAKKQKKLHESGQHQKQKKSNVLLKIVANKLILMTGNKSLLDTNIIIELFKGKYSGNFFGRGNLQIQPYTKSGVKT